MENAITCRLIDPTKLYTSENEHYHILDLRACRLMDFPLQFLNRFKALTTVDIRDQWENFDCLTIPLTLNYTLLWNCKLEENEDMTTYNATSVHPTVISIPITDNFLGLWIVLGSGTFIIIITLLIFIFKKFYKKNTPQMNYHVFFNDIYNTLEETL